MSSMIWSSGSLPRRLAGPAEGRMVAIGDGQRQCVTRVPDAVDCQRAGGEPNGGIGGEKLGAVAVTG
jgi:hypothetical protein